MHSWSTAVYDGKNVFSLKNVVMKNTNFSKPLRFPFDAFKQLKEFPDPAKKVGNDKYEDFADVYGKSIYTPLYNPLL